jgi:hypothetical protein
MLKSHSCISQKTNVEITFMYLTDGSIHKTIAEITFMYFTTPILKSLSCISQNRCWHQFHVFHETNFEIIFMYFTNWLFTWKIRPILKSLSCISQNHRWNHFHVFHKIIVEITFMYFTTYIWNHFHVFHINQCWNHFHVFQRWVSSQNHCWNHFHVFHKINVEITFKYFTRPRLKSLSCISQMSSSQKRSILKTLSCFSIGQVAHKN